MNRKSFGSGWPAVIITTLNFIPLHLCGPACPVLCQSASQLLLTRKEWEAVFYSHSRAQICVMANCNFLDNQGNGP